MVKKIMLVDDDLNLLNSLKRVLHDEFDIETFTCGSDALAALDKEEYAVVVSDMKMPEMDGVTLLAKIRDKVPNTIRAMLTGNADLQTAIEAVNVGSIFRFQLKPCSPENMKTTLTACL